jgi:general secretion pathway protein H
MSSPSDHRAAAGFTLIEMLVVLAILALVIALVPPLLSGGQAEAQFTAAAHEIAAGLRETRSLAIRTGRTEAFTLDLAAGTFRGAGADRAHHLPSGIRLSLLTASEDRIADDAGRIRFFADGSSTGGSIRLEAGATQSDVLVDWLSGRISLVSHAPSR